MNPSLDEALRTLHLAERDIVALKVLTGEPGVHVSISGFHAQQAIEKSLKAVLFARFIEFERTHDLVNLAGLLRSHDVEVPFSDDELRWMNPFAVTFRYDDMDIETSDRESFLETAMNVFRWAERVVQETSEG